jgi:hypothetical protein
MNPVPLSYVQKKTLLTICDRIIFKRIHENVLREGQARYKTGPPLSPAEISAGPTCMHEDDIQDWRQRLENTPLSERELAARPKFDPLWTRRREITPLSVDERNNPPPYGSPERQLWRERGSIGRDTYGHWWVEIYKTPLEYSIGNLEASYGWWPERPVDLIETARGVPGCLNFNETFDPHADQTGIDWMVDEAFHPVIQGNEAEAVKGITDFATGYAGKHPNRKWAFPALAGDRANCQTFQEEMIEYCKNECKMTDAKIPVNTSRIRPPTPYIK